MVQNGLGLGKLPAFASMVLELWLCPVTVLPALVLEICGVVLMPGVAGRVEMRPLGKKYSSAVRCNLRTGVFVTTFRLII